MSLSPGKHILKPQPNILVHFVGQINGTITFVRNENMSYPACTHPYAGKTCNKKCSENGGGWCAASSFLCAKLRLAHFQHISGFGPVCADGCVAATSLRGPAVPALCCKVKLQCDSQVV